METSAGLSSSNEAKTNANVSDASPLYVEVVLPLRLPQAFTYRLPPQFRTQASIGARLLVPFGKKLATAYIVKLHDVLDPSLEISESEIKEAGELLDAEPLFTPGVMGITQWISEYYAAPWGEVLKAALPSGLNATIEQIITISEKGRESLSELPAHRRETAKAVVLKRASLTGATTLVQTAHGIGLTRAAKAARELERDGLVTVTYRPRSGYARTKRRKSVRLIQTSGHETLTELQGRIVGALADVGGEMLLAELLNMTSAATSSVSALERKGIVEIVTRDVRRDPLAGVALPTTQNFALTEEQTAALTEITAAQSQDKYECFLLHGVTGSGKTEIYIRAMRSALERGRSAMMLVPEIALTPVFSRRLRAHFGDAVAIFHSSLTTGERFDEWSRLKTHEARVVIGTRSAVFAPVENLGLVIVDEEHEASYRQQESPYYNGRDTAIMRAHRAGAVVILGSATPSLESFYNARRGKYRYLRLPNRVAGRAMAIAEMIDMREVFSAAGKPEVFSPALLEAIEETHARHEQSIILLNRRGYSSFILCRSCGERINCVNCDVTLTYHRRERSLVCHYCDMHQRVPSSCPSCDGKYIYFIGEGTEQIEEMLRARFPTLEIARLDRDTTSRRRTYEQVVLRFGAGEIDMLVGTQMIAKGHDFPNVTLVGVVSVDVGLALPDFRASERTFQLITQVAGRAGRGDLPGRVLIQTYYPKHYALRHASAQDYQSFFEEELRYRKALSYPPFVVLASILVHSENLARVHATATGIRQALDAANSDRSIRVLGPAPAPLARLRGEHRMQLLLKARSRKRLREIIDAALENAGKQEGCDLQLANVEIDPVNMM